jgi:hypothetical protein
LNSATRAANAGGIAGHIGCENPGQSDKTHRIDKSTDGRQGDGEAGFLAEGIGGGGEHSFIKPKIVDVIRPKARVET